LSTTLVMSLGELFKQTRRATGMTQTELSERSGIQKGTVSKIENDEVKRPEFSTVQPLAAALNISLDTLIDYYVEIEKRPDSLLHILQFTIQHQSSKETVCKVASKYLESANEDSYDLTNKLYTIINSIEDSTIQLTLYNLIIGYSRSHGIMPYIAKGMYQRYLIERNDFSKLKETYHDGKYILLYSDFLSLSERIELYYKLGVHAYNIRLYSESIEHCKEILTENIIEHKVNALGILRDAYFALEEYEESEFYALQYKQFNYPYVQDNIILMDAMFASHRGEFEKAQFMLTSFLETCKSDAAILAINQLLQIHIKQNNHKMAEVLINNNEISPISEDNPFVYQKYADHLHLRGQYYLSIGDYAKSINSLIQAALYYAKVDDTFKEKDCLNTVMRIHLDYDIPTQDTFEKLSTYYKKTEE